MCKFISCDKRYPYKKCSSIPSKNHSYIYSKRNNGPLDLYSLQHNNDILVVFEAPGIDEWSKGEPVCSNRRGSAGYKFNTELNNQGKQKSSYDIAEAVRCFPGTSTKTINKKDQAELKKATKYCQKYLKDIILRKNYEKIVCFGELAETMVSSIIKSLHRQKNPYYSLSYLKENVKKLVHPMKNKKLSDDIEKNL